MKAVAVFLEKISGFFERILVFVLQFSVGVLILDLNLAVLFRYVLKKPIVGTQEIALLLLAWITFLGASLCVKHHSLVAVTFLLEKFGKFEKLAQLIIQAFIFLFSLLFLIYGYKWVTSPNVLQIKTSALQIPAWIAYCIVPVSMIVTMVFNIRNIFKILTGSSADFTADFKREAEML